MTPCGRQTIRANTNFNAMCVHWTIVTTTNVVLACPDELDRSAAQAFGNHCCFAGNMRIRSCTSSESTAGEFCMEGDLFRFQTENYGNDRLVHCLKLRRDPGFRLLTFDFDGRDQRFHLAVRQVEKPAL